MAKKHELTQEDRRAGGRARGMLYELGILKYKDPKRRKTQTAQQPTPKRVPTKKADESYYARINPNVGRYGGKTRTADEQAAEMSWEGRLEQPLDFSLSDYIENAFPPPDFRPDLDRRLDEWQYRRKQAMRYWESLQQRGWPGRFIERKGRVLEVWDTGIFPPKPYIT
jgi:hypothetical protein